MTTAQLSTPFVDFLRRNWFQVALGLIVLYLFFQKNMSFEINLQSPTHQEQFEKPKRKIKMTDKSVAVSPSKEEVLNLDPIKNNGTYASSLKNISAADKAKYLKRFAKVAVQEQEKFGIPASIILANALLHSRAGITPLSKNDNNQFMLPCGKNWNRESTHVKKQCYRKYETSWMSFRDHSKYLTSGRYKTLSRLSSKDYKNWAKGLEELRYSNTPNLSNELVRIINSYKLYELDQ